MPPEIEAGVPLGEDAGAVAIAPAPEDLGGLREHMGAAHTEASGRTATSERGRNIVGRVGERMSRRQVVRGEHAPRRAG